MRALSNAVEARDAYTGKHAERVTAYGMELTLAPDPADRFSSAGDMSKALERALSELGEEPDLGGWVLDHLSPATRARRAEIARGPQAGSIASFAAA